MATLNCGIKDTYDGHFGISSQATVAAARDGTNGSGTASSKTAVTISLRVQRTSGAVYSIRRPYLPFDISGLPDGAIIDGAHINLSFISSNGNQTGAFGTFSSTQVIDANAINVAYYDKQYIGTTDFGGTSFGKSGDSFPATGSYDLNQAGVDYVQSCVESGVVKFALREYADYNELDYHGVDPETWSNNFSEDINIGSYENSEAYRPVLILTYHVDTPEPPAPPSFVLSPLARFFGFRI